MKKIYSLFLALFLALCSYGLKAQVLQADSLALVDFYTAAGGPNWTSQGNWLTGPVSTWSGITVANNRVTKLEVSMNNMVGTVSPSVGNLTELTALRLQGDETTAKYVDLHGAFPKEIWNCTKLTILQLKYTKISSWDTTGIDKLQALTELNLMATKVGGTLPASIFTLPNIQKLYLHYCNFTGAVPSTISQAKKLTRFYVWGGSKLSSLPYVDITNKGAAKIELYGNFLSFADVKPYADSHATTPYAGYSNAYQYTQDTIVVKKIAGSKFVMHGATANGEGYAWFKDAGTTSPTGTPVATDDSLVITNLALANAGTYTCVAQSSMVANFSILTVYKLKVVEANTLESDSLALIDFYKAAGGPNWTNQGNWLTGPISTWSGVTVANNRVTKLEVSMNNMVGTVSPSVGNLTELTALRLQGDETTAKYVDLHGAFPKEIWNCTKLTILQLKYTKISSWDTTGIDKLQALTELNLMATKVGGTLPASIFTLPNIQKLYLHYCNFTGAVPSTITQAKKLTRFYIWGGSKLTSLPYVDITNKGAAKIELTGNFLSFADVKPYADSHAATPYAGYSNAYQFTNDTTNVSIWAGSKYVLHGAVANGEGYAWFKDAGTTSPTGTPIATDDSLTISSASISNSGIYTCVAQSSMVPNFSILTVYKINVMPYDLKSDSLALVDFYKAAGGPNWTDQGNWLTGPVNTWSGVTVTDGRVTKLEITMNNMVGTVSPSIGNLTELTALRLMGDEAAAKYVDLHGALPKEVWNCTKLNILQLKYTKISSWDTTGISNLQALTELNLMATKVGGTLPASIFTLPNIQKLYLHYCNFTGVVPSAITKATKLTRFYVFGGNKLTSLPYVDITNKGAAKIELTGNYFTFADVKPYAQSHATTPYAGYTNTYQFAQDTMTITADERSSYKFSLKVTGGEGYNWFKDDATTPIASDSIYQIASLALTDAGTYVCKVQSSEVANFDIRAAFILKVNHIEVAAPTFVSAANDAVGTKISVTFDKAMADPSAAAASFKVKVNGIVATIKSATLDATNKKVIVVELSSASLKNEAITLSYEGTSIKSEDGGVLAAFSGKTVTNNSTVTSIEVAQKAFTIYPNPFADKLIVNSSENVENVKIFDVTGKMVYTLNNNASQEIRISVSDLAQGVYFISITSGNVSSIQKIIKK